MLVVFKFKSLPLVPMSKSTWRVPPEVVSVPHVAVLVASALESAVMVLAVSTPPEADGAKVADRASSANRVLPARAVLTVAGRVPE